MSEERIKKEKQVVGDEGTELLSGQKAAVNGGVQSIQSVQPKRYTKRGLFEKKKLGLLATSVVVLATLAISLGVYNTPENRLARQLDLGNKYLEDQMYAEAVVAFEKAIQIDERCIAAYVNGIEAYGYLNEPENLLAFYEKALEAARSLEGEALGADMDAVVSIYLAAEEIYSDRNVLLTVWEEGYEKSGQDSRIRDWLVDAYLDRAEERASDGDYEESLQDYGRLLELDGRNKDVLDGLAECLKSYLDVLMEEENFEKVRKLAEKYASILQNFDFDTYLNGLQPIEWQDAALESLMRRYLGKPEGDIRVFDVQGIEDIVIYGGSISIHGEETQNDSIGQIQSLDDLKYFKSLHKLTICNNQINNIDALSVLPNLGELDLRYNEISDISALSGMSNLEQLWLDNNTISDINALSDLTNLYWLDLSGNEISDVSALSRLTNLEYVHLHDNTISDISALSGLTRLKGLGLGNNQISDIRALSGMTNLESLALDYNIINDISVLSNLSNLEDLLLDHNEINDISALSSLMNLEELWLSANEIHNISALSGMTNLVFLDLCFNRISSIDALSSLTSLEELWLSANEIHNISALSGLTKLERLRLDGNQISDISALSGLTQLKELWMQANNITDYSPVSFVESLWGD